MNWTVPLSDVNYGPEEEAAVLRVLRSRWLSMGAETAAFEAEFAAACGVRHAIACANGTAALHLALLALGVGEGDEVIQPAVNFVASANMTVAVGAVPVFGDIIGLEEPTLSPAEIERRISPRTRAAVVMHYGGHFARMAEIGELCRRHGIALIEDACHAVGGRYHDSASRPPHGRCAGALGDIACFSFFSNKNLVTGEGGAVTTDRDDVCEKVRNLRSHGMSTLTWDRHRGHASTYDVLAHGYNYRMDDLRSALGREQLKKLDGNNRSRRELTALYWERLAALEAHGWILPFHKPSESSLQSSSFSSSACHLLPVVAPDAAIRSHCAASLRAAGIQTSLHYPFIPDFTGFSGTCSPDGLDDSRSFCSRVITLPLFPTMTREQVRTVCTTLMRSLHPSTSEL